MTQPRSGPQPPALDIPSDPQQHLDSIFARATELALSARMFVQMHRTGDDGILSLVEDVISPLGTLSIPVIPLAIKSIGNNISRRKLMHAEDPITVIEFVKPGDPVPKPVVLSSGHNEATLVPIVANDMFNLPPLGDRSARLKCTRQGYNSAEMPYIVEFIPDGTDKDGAPWPAQRVIVGPDGKFSYEGVAQGRTEAPYVCASGSPVTGTTPTTLPDRPTTPVPARSKTPGSPSPVRATNTIPFPTISSAPPVTPVCDFTVISPLDFSDPSEPLSPVRDSSGRPSSDPFSTTANLPDLPPSSPHPHSPPPSPPAAATPGISSLDSTEGPRGRPLRAEGAFYGRSHPHIFWDERWNDELSSEHREPRATTSSSPRNPQHQISTPPPTSQSSRPLRRSYAFYDTSTSSDATSASTAGSNADDLPAPPTRPGPHLRREDAFYDTTTSSDYIRNQAPATSSIRTTRRPLQRESTFYPARAPRANLPRGPQPAPRRRPLQRGSTPYSAPRPRVNPPHRYETAASARDPPAFYTALMRGAISYDLPFSQEHWVGPSARHAPTPVASSSRLTRTPLSSAFPTEAEDKEEMDVPAPVRQSRRRQTSGASYSTASGSTGPTTSTTQRAGKGKGKKRARDDDNSDVEAEEERPKRRLRSADREKSVDPNSGAGPSRTTRISGGIRKAVKSLAGALTKDRK